MMPGAEPPSLVPAVLEVRGLTIRFGDVRVVDDLSLTVADGESLAIIGPSGAGKTVLFKALIGALPYEGTIRWAANARYMSVLLMGSLIIIPAATAKHVGPQSGLHGGRRGGLDPDRYLTRPLASS